MAASAGLGALPALEMKCLRLLYLVPRKSESCRGQFVKVTGVRGLFFGQHAALTRANPGSGQLGAFRESNLRLFRQCTETHVGHEQWNVELEWLVCIAADHYVGTHRFFIEQRQFVQLAYDELYVVPFRQLITRHAHRRGLTVVSDLAQALIGQITNEFDIRFVGRSRVILVDTLVGIALVRLRMGFGPGFYLILIDQHITVFDPRVELRQRFRVLVLTDTRVEAVVPTMHATDQVIAFDETVRHQRATMRTTAVHDRHFVIESNYDEIDISDKRMLWRAVFKFFPVSNRDFVHAAHPTIQVVLGEKIDGYGTTAYHQPIEPSKPRA